MKKVLLILALIVAAVACGGEKAQPPPPTPGPLPEATVVVEPCRANGVGSGSRTVWTGDCAASATCRDGGDGFFYGSDCRTR